MHKLLVFDLDGTLAPVAKGTSYDNIGRLKKLEQMGYRIVICSGKPTFYLCGFARQLELDSPILIGENGAVVQYGVSLPPKRYEVYPCTDRAKEQLKAMKDKISKACGDRIWYQPNEIELTPFTGEAEVLDIIQEIVDNSKDELDELLVYRHWNCFDFIPKNIHKANGIEMVAKLEGLDRKDTLALGDGVNDVPMFQYADISMRIGNDLDYPTDYSFDDISSALDYVMEQKL
ncbi:MAG: HAD family phosphatase [Lachnospiraceae bacterium]|nr:HAD family phosphatase [Lachnospiraceae bacterium]